jgi:hypothetical protein
MADANHEKVMFAREVFNLFAKAFTQLKLYPHDHTYCVSAIEDFSSRVRSYVNLHNVLRITVTQDTLAIGDAAVYTAEDRKENLAFRLYVDGLREISISLGVTPEESERLCLVFYQAIVDPDSDSTLLMWEGDFSSIDYAAINSLTEAWESPDYFDNEQLDLLKKMNRDVDAIVNQLTQNDSRGTYSFELSDTGSELDSIQDFGDDDMEDREEEDIFAVDDDALSEFLRECALWGPDRMLKEVVEHALDGFAVDREIITRELMTWLLQEAAQMSLRSRDMDLLGSLLTRYETELSVLNNEDDVTLVKQVFAWLGRDENIDRLVAMALSGRAVGGPSAFAKILTAMGGPGVACGVLTYLQADSEEMRDALVTCLQGSVHKNPLALLPMLDPEQPPDVVKAGMFVINKAEGAIKSKKLSALLSKCREHSDPEITKYATHLWRNNTREGKAAQLMDALMAEKRVERVRALQQLVRVAWHPAADRIKEVIADESFPRRDVHERGAFIEALRLLGGTTAAPFLEQQTKRKTLVFNRKAIGEIRQFAQRALNDLKAGG